MNLRRVEPLITKSGLIQATLSGSLSAFSFFDSALWFAIFLSISWLLILLKGSKRRESFWIGWFFGLGYFSSNIWWIHISIENFSDTNAFIAITLNSIFICFLAFYFAIFGIVSNISLKSSFPQIFIIPLIWLLLELARSNFFTGFPWLVTGYTQLDSPLASLLPVIGAHGVSFVIVSLSFGVVSLFFPGRFYEKALIVFSIIGFISALNIVEPPPYTFKTKSRPFTISLIQGSVPKHIRWSTNSTNLILEHYLELSKGEWGSDLVLWPETVFTKPFSFEENEIKTLSNIAEKTDTNLILGIPFFDTHNSKIYNSVLLVGKSTDLYKKRKLVPFGEYFPFRGIVAGLYNKIDIPLSDFSQGPSGKNKIFIEKRAVGILICYEVIFSSIARSSIPEAEFIINVSNDSWFGDTVAAYQHLQIVRVRAAELGRPIIRATNTGISSVIDHNGRVLKISGTFSPEVIRSKLLGRDGLTPYSKLGETGVVFGSIILALLAFVHRFIRYRYFCERK